MWPLDDHKHYGISPDYVKPKPRITYAAKQWLCSDGMSMFSQYGRGPTPEAAYLQWKQLQTYSFFEMTESDLMEKGQDGANRTLQQH